MSKMRDTLSGMDFPALGASILLVVIGIMSIYSSGTDSSGALVSGEYLKQLMWAGIGLALLLALVVVDYRQLRDYAGILFVALVLVLVYTRLFGKVVNGARAWIGIGELGIQPSEFAKLAAILFLARYLDNSEHEGHLRRLVISFGIILLPVGLILSQPDFGTSLVFFPILFFMLLVAGIGRRHLAFIGLTGAIMAVLTILPLWEKYILPKPTGFLFILYTEPYEFLILLGFAVILGISTWSYGAFKKRYYWWINYFSASASLGLGLSFVAHRVLKDYQIMRLIVFMDPSIDPRGSGWNIIQSITAIGSGGFGGRGFLAGPQSHNRYIPQQSTDFIFSIIAEEWGFLGGLVVFSLFFIILWRCVVILRNAKDRFAVYVTAGIMGMIAFHFMVNAGMAMGIMPITGIPLLFLSYGGSSLLAVMASMGVLLGISARRYH